MREKNQTVLQQWEDELPESTVYWMLIAIVCAQAWTIYLTYYNSRIIGLILTAILNRLVKYGHIKMGSCSFSVLSGKIMFRDVHLITEDFSVRVQIGWVIFRWWRPYVYKDLSEDLSHSETRLSVFLDGFEFHVYNRWQTYAQLEKLFGVSLPSPPHQPPSEPNAAARLKVPEGSSFHWRDLIPMIKMDITSGRVVFGNYLVPHSLLVKFEKADMMYTTKPASTLSDLFMHVVKCEAENLSVAFVPSPKYTGPLDEPPRTMGEGFVVLQSNSVDIYFYMDEPGLVPHEPELLQLADGEVLVRRTYPCSGVDIKCGKNTDLSYGPWADRQRELLWKLFYPADYQPMVPTPDAQPGERRQHKTLELKMTINANSTIDILFTKSLITQAIHMTAGKGSYIEAVIPWTVEETGYVSKVKGQLMLVDATTSNMFRSLLECETFEFDVTANYPVVWNQHQDWRVDFTACKAVVYIIFAHKEFFKDLADDWSTKSIPDLYSFVPYTWTINLMVKQFELITLANQFNWTDTSSHNQENTQIAFCGELFDLCVTLPYTDFLPPTFPIHIAIKGETVDCCLYLPENNTLRHVIIAISENMKIVDRDGNEMDKPFGFNRDKQWRNLTQYSAGWVDCWHTSCVSLTVTYVYHPLPLLQSLHHPPSPGSLPSPELEEAILSPLRPDLPGTSRAEVTAENFDPADWETDHISVELEVAPSVLCLYGSLLRNLIHVKENYFGEDQVVRDFAESRGGQDDREGFVHITCPWETSEMEPFDPRQYRPFSVTVAVTLHDIQAHLVKNCNKEDPPCPCIHVERLGFEMDKKFTNTKLQLLLSPCILIARDNLQREGDQDHLREGHLALSGLQVRGHALFSHAGLPLDAETLEYAWLIDAVIGTVTGKLTTPQLQNVAEFIQTFVMLVDNPENRLSRAVPFPLCQHLLPQPQCRLTPDPNLPCPTSEDLKYRMVRLSLDSVTVFVVEAGSALNLNVRPVRIANCNLHGATTREGVTGVVERVSLVQFINCAQSRVDGKHQDTWLEAGGVTLGPITLEAAMALPDPRLHALQDAFLRAHDRRSSRLWFLWPPPPQQPVAGSGGGGAAGSGGNKCGCLGGCEFFGANRKGATFFRPRKHRESSQVAIPQVCSAGHDPGFGQSLLHEGRLVLELGSPSKLSPTQFSFTRGYMSDLASPDTADDTVIRVTETGRGREEVGVVREEMGVVREEVGVARDQLGLVGTGFRPLSAHSDSLAFQTSTPLPGGGAVDLRQDSLSLSGQSSPQDRYHRHVFSASIPSSPLGVRGDRPCSVSSGRSTEGATRQSSRSSLASPATPRHVLDLSTRRGNSSLSLDSERYYSAEEDVDTGSEADLDSALAQPSPSFWSHDNTVVEGDSGTLTRRGVRQQVGERERPDNSDKDRERSGTLRADVGRLRKVLVEDVSDDDDEKGRGSSSSSSSCSTLSYTSAPSEQGEDSDDIPEDMTLVDLHAQMNQPITHSPLLLNCYMRHLSQFQCHDWLSPGPVHAIYPIKKGLRSVQSEYSLSSASHSMYSATSTWMPHFTKVKEGFSMSAMRQKEEVKLPSPPSKKPLRPVFSFGEGAAEGGAGEQGAGPEQGAGLSENTSKTTAIVEVTGALDLLVTPLLLESLQRYVEAVTPTLSKLHPSALIDGLHSQCLDRLKQQNKLKKQGEGEEEAQPPNNTTNGSSSRQRPSVSGEEGLDVAKTSSLQAVFTMPRINMCVLQASIVEEVIPFSSLEKVNDLMAVSLLSLCLDSLTCRLLANRHSCTLAPPAPTPTRDTSATRPLSAASTTRAGTKGATDIGAPVEKDKEDVLEVSREENVGTLHISRLHAQLRRLLKHSNYCDNIVLTAIPDHRSSVLFTFSYDAPPPPTVSPAQPPATPRRRLSRQSSRDYRDDPLLASIGFIMMECGLEDVAITAVRRLGYQDQDEALVEEKLDGLEKVLTDLQTQTRDEIDDQTPDDDTASTPTDDPVPLSSPSARHSTVSLSSSWDSAPSPPPSDLDTTEVKDPRPAPQPLKGDASTGILKLKTVWFNFAAPPPISIKKKVDFTRLDWNLLSTATPAINAWMNPSDRLMLSVKQLVRVLSMRTCSVIACMMTEALDVQGIHVAYKSKFGKLCRLSRTLQEDPSCQLLTVLRKYLHKVSPAPTERAVAADTLPQIITLQKGVLALMRQWKNVLYMPNLADLNFKARRQVRPYTVSFALPHTPSTDALCLQDDDDGAGTVENFDVVDERMSLLQAEGGAPSNPPSLGSRGRHSSTRGDNPTADGVSLGSSVSFRNKKLGTLFSQLGGRNKSKATTTSSGPGFDSPEHRPTPSTLTPAGGGCGGGGGGGVVSGGGVSGALLRNDSNLSFTSVDSVSSLEQFVSPTPPHTPLKGAGPGAGRPTSILKNCPPQQEGLYQWMAKQQQQKDFYQWMAKQQDGFKLPMEEELKYGGRGQHHDSWMGLGSAWSQDDSHTDLNEEHSTVATSIMQLADAQILFKPFLQSLGLHVESVRPSAMMKNFGGHLLLQGHLDILKIQIAESQASPHYKGKVKAKGKRQRLNVNAGTPAFVCEGFEVDVSMKDVVDFGAGDDGAAPFPTFAMHKLEAKPTTLQMNLMVEAQAITQHVDMALLRLVHQVLTMVDNIKETQVELKERRSSLDWVRTHRKQASKDSTSSADTQQSDLSHTDRLTFDFSHSPVAPSTDALGPASLDKVPAKSTYPQKPSSSEASKAFSAKPTSGETSSSAAFEKAQAKSLKPSSHPSGALGSRRPDALSVAGGSKKPSSQLRFAKDAKKAPAPKSEVTSGQPEVMTPPQSLNLSDSVTIDMADTSSPAVNEKTIIDEIKASTPQCWRHLYHLLDLYSTMPEPKTVLRRPNLCKPLPVIHEEEDKDSDRHAATPATLTSTTFDPDLKASMGRMDLAAAEESRLGDHPPLARTSFIRTRFKQSIYIGESVPLVVFGIAKIQKVQMLAELSGLKLEAELRKVHATGTYKKKVKGFLHRKSSDSSFTAHVGRTMIMLLEGVPPGMQTVVTVNISRSQALHTTLMRRGKEHNSALVAVGTIDVNIPQHPVVLHGMMTRSSRRLTSTLQEFRWPLSRTGKGQESNETNNADTQPHEREEEAGRPAAEQPLKAKGEKVKDRSLHIHFKAVFNGLTIGASILPSLKAQHKTGSITVTGITGKKARFNLVLPKHTLSFKSKVTTSGETTIPSSASIELPPIQVLGDYRQAKSDWSAAGVAMEEGLQLREGSYLNAVAEVGMLEHSLTTDLLNHLVFVQKVFMKEVNEVVQKVSGSDQPLRLWSEDDRRVIETHRDTLLYSFSIRLKGIQITATTPTSNAVRFETGEITLDLSNRVQISSREAGSDDKMEEAQKMFVQAVVDLNLALGQLLRNPVFEEAEPEFHTMAFFKTTIRVRNALQDEMVPQVSSDQEALLIHLSRPIMLAQPAAFDKAVLVWLNYKNAYEYWTEQRLTLNTEVLTATRQVMDKLPAMAPSPASASFSTLFLQLTVDDMGICVPLNSSPFQSQGTSTSRMVDSEPGAALVLTVESTEISACSSGSLISKGKFEGFCLRFANDFETSWDDWKPTSTESMMNLCTVPAGTYEVCSRTINKQASDPLGNAKWILNVTWEMQGIEVHLDTNIGKQLSALGHTLTAITGDRDLDHPQAYSSDGNDNIDYDDLDNEATDTDEPEFASRRTSLAEELLPDAVLGHDADPKERARHIEHQMNEQAKVVQDLKQLGASESTIEAEKRRLEELQNMLFHDFRRDVLNKLKRQSDRHMDEVTSRHFLASVIRDKLGLGSRPTHIRSRSYGGRRRDGVRRNSTQLQSQTLDRPRNFPSEATDYQPSSSRVQFGATQHSIYTPPRSPDSFSVSFDEADYRSGRGSGLKKTWSLQDILSSDSSLSSSDNDTRTRHSVSSQGTSRAEGREGLGSGSSGKGLLEPNVDFELDVKVFIDNGKCILYPKEAKEEEFKRQQGKRERHATGDPQVPGPQTRQKMKRMESAPPALMSKKQPAPVETTVFFLPSVDVKVHYNSKTSFFDGNTSSSASGLDIGFGHSMSSSVLPDRASDDVTSSHPPHYPYSMPHSMDSMRESTAPDVAMETGSVSGGSRKAVKKANLYAWLSLQTLSEEMIISPCLLDFLEQALEPLPISPSTQHKKAASVDVGSMLHLNMDLDASQASLGLPMGGTFFPVDVVVNIKVEPSTIRFNCQPISRVECLLQVPSLELVFSTKKTDVEGLLSDGTPPTKPKLGKRLSRDRHSSGSQGGPGGRGRLNSGVSDTQGGMGVGSNSGGLSVTGCLSDFSLYVFHPYGTGQRRFFQGSPSFSGTQRSHVLGSILEHGASFMEMAGKDSLSLNVEFIRVNISRTRKLEIVPAPDLSKLDPQAKSTIVRFSAICDIGKASFKYDMRRLSEILSLPKAWYRRNLARRLFLGDDSMARAGGEDDLDESTSSASTTASPEQRPLYMNQNSVSSPSINAPPPLPPPTPHRRTHHRRASSGDKVKVQVSTDLKNEIASRKGRSSVYQSYADPASRDMASSSRTNGGPRARGKHPSPELQHHHQQQQQQQQLPGVVSSSWETLVLFAVNLSRLNVEVNMSNVMGHTVWKTRDVKSTGRLSIDSNGHKNLKISAGLGGSSFDSRGGVVGGAIDLQDLSTFFQVSEDPDLGQDPDHRAGLTLFALEGRVDYMGSSVLMTRLSRLNLSLHDEWHVEKHTAHDVPVATTRAANLFVNGALSWDQFHMMISRSTTPDLIKLGGKVEEFFSQQLTSGRRAFAPLGPVAGTRRAERPPSQDSVLAELRHHRHWQGALEHLSGCQFSMLPQVLPSQGMILGGTITLSGRNLTLASFHGINFRSRYWALFNILHPYILFSTEAQKVEDEGVHIVEDLQFMVGQDQRGGAGGVGAAVGEAGQPVATICKVSRGHIAPQQFTSVREWFSYAFSSIEKDMEAFPEIKREQTDSPGETRKSRKSQMYSHEMEIIFALPALYMNLKSTHCQAKHEPEQDDPKPVVESSFVTEFYDHIKVAMDAEVILFLHDLVMSYIKEKDKGSRMSSHGAARGGGGGERSPDNERRRLTDPTTALKQDWREFRCKTWQMEPTVRLLHWASTQIDPVGADYVLQKLGFSHARVTIPKWMQRGFMDPLDKILSMLVERLIVTLSDQQQRAEEEGEK